jgi:hypothetical protein
MAARSLATERRLKRLFLLLVFCLVQWASEARAEDVVLAYRAPEQCPKREALLRAARTRAPEIRLADEPSSSSSSVRVRIKKGAEGFLAAIELRNSDAFSERALTAATCAELVEATGLLISFFVSPDPPETTKTDPVEAPAPPIALTSETAADAPSMPPPRARRTEPSRYAPFLGGAIESDLAVLPDLALGGGVFGGIERTDGLVAPAFRIAASFASSDLASGPKRDGSFLRALGRADACPLRWEIASWASLRPCAVASLGLVHAEGAAVRKPISDTRPWADVGARLRARADLRSFFFELEAGLLVPLTRPTFVFENPRVVVHETPPIGAFFAIGGGHRFL